MIVKKITFITSTSVYGVNLIEYDLYDKLEQIVSHVRKNDKKIIIDIRCTVTGSNELEISLIKDRGNTDLTDTEIVKSLISEISNKGYVFYSKNYVDNSDKILDYGYNNRAKVRFVFNIIFNCILYMFKAMEYIVYLMLPLIFLPYFIYYTIAGFLEFIYKDVKIAKLPSIEDFRKSEYYLKMEYSEYLKKMSEYTYIYEHCAFLVPLEILIISFFFLTCQYNISIFKGYLYFIQFLINQSGISLNLLQLYLNCSIQVKLLLNALYIVVGHLLFYNIIINFLKKHKLI